MRLVSFKKTVKVIHDLQFYTCYSPKAENRIKTINGAAF